MDTIKTAKASALFPVIQEILDAGGKARLTVTGTSMFPFLHDGRDSVELQKVYLPELKRGDIVLFQRLSGEYILHRVVRIEPHAFFVMGDNQQWLEGPLYPDQLIAIAGAVWRGDKRVCCRSFGWRFLSGFWLLVIPFRGEINKLLYRMEKARAGGLIQKG